MDNTKQKIHNRIKSRKAVAPIIATLLMIAIAVVGGVMIYVFTQGFFGNSSISTSPSVDTITMSGYDMREIVPAVGPPAAGITTHEGAVLTTYGTIATPGLMAAGEEGSIFIKNVGAKGYTISKLEVNGVAMNFVATPLVAGQYGVITVPDTKTLTAGTTLQAAQTVLPGQEATLIISFNDAVGFDNTAASGRTIPVKVTSAGGSVYNFNVVIGSKV